MPRQLAHALAVIALALPLGTSAQQPQFNKWDPPAMERIRLPQYCQAQFDTAWGKQYKIPTPMDLCGPGMNHFCPGLVMLNRARNTLLSRDARRAYVRDAMMELGYTRARIPANCAIMPDFQAAEAQAKTLSQLLK